MNEIYQLKYGMTLETQLRDEMSAGYLEKGLNYFNFEL